MNIIVILFEFIVLTIGTLFILLFLLIIYFFKKKTFPKRSFIVSCVIVAIFGIFLLFKPYFFTFNRIDEENLTHVQGPIESASGKYFANAYYEPFGGYRDKVVVKVTYVETNQENILYYAEAKSIVRIAWDFDDKLFIFNEEFSTDKSNYNISLDVEKEIYHDKGLACQSIVMRNSYEKCYQNES